MLINEDDGLTKEKKVTNTRPGLGFFSLVQIGGKKTGGHRDVFYLMVRFLRIASPYAAA